MRNVGRHSSLVDVATIRTFMSLGGLVPLPPDALVTPVTFRVRRRKLRGILAPCDAMEDGSRELSGEWVVSKKLWQRLQSEWKAAHKHKDGEPVPTKKSHKERVILYLHGGAYYVFSAATHRGITIPLSKFADTRVFAVDYRLSPETRFPGSLHDAASAYFRLIEDLHIPPENVLVAGDSAGGGLALALMMYLRDNDYPLPAGAILMSPWVDLTRSCDSWDSNEPYDVISIPEPGDHLDPVACYLGPHLERYLTHPYASPLFGDFKGLPPMLIQAGDAEVLRDEITLLAHKASLAGVQVHHELYEDAIHVFQAFPFLDAAHEAFVSCRMFVRTILPQVQAHSPRSIDSDAEDEMEYEMDNEKTRVFGGDGMPKAFANKEDIAADTGDDETSVDTIEDETDESSDTHAVYKEVRLPEQSRSVEGSPSTSTRPLSPFLRVRKTHSSELSTPKPKPPSYHGALISPVVSRPEPLRRTSRHGRTSAAFSMSPAVTVAPLAVPPPTTRSRSTSHPDIASMCRDWGDSGPANATATYPLNRTVRHAKSSSFSFARP
ncbi:hypothetical protein DENSPDRAFT_833031 [Dentipellis sp. KUC8613]|nr:hypothetical protein DENSPDRAFT_833031 [Dentipellis sp. KUC8613]